LSYFWGLIFISFHIRLFGILTLLVSCNILFAQQVPDSGKSSVHVIHSEYMRFERKDGKEIQYLSKDIAVLHKKTYLFCDSAVIDGQYVLAMGHVRIVEGDSLQIFGDTLYYDGRLLQSSFKNNVVLIHRDRQLFTQELQYDLKKRIASYLTGGLLNSNTTRLRSQRGYYHAKEERAYFKDSVNVLLDQGMNLQADSLIFDARSDQVLFTGPTRILQDEMNMYTEEGYHDISGNRSFFTGNPNYRKKDQLANARKIISLNQEDQVILTGDAWIRDSVQEARGDSLVIDNKKDLVYIFGNGWYRDRERSLRGERLRYNRQTKSLEVEGRTEVSEGTQLISADRIVYSGDEDLGRAYGQVALRDTQSGLMIRCDSFFYNKKTKTLIPIGKHKYIATPVDQDTLYLTADSLISTRKTTEMDSFTVMSAFYRVRIWSRRFQAVCDSLYFDGRDSVFRLHRDPVMWSDSTQFTGDTILVYLRNKAMDQIHLQDRAFVLAESTTGLNNQMKGRYIQSQFEKSRARYLDVLGNAESHYFIQDDNKGYIGANYIRCSNFRIYFGEGQKVEKIHFYNKPEGNMIPVAEGRDKKLEGYRSRASERPASLEEILHGREEWLIMKEVEEQIEQNQEK
jgi:lipopolysaccharide export system protein LptA